MDERWSDLCCNCGWKPKRRGGEECDACAKYRQRNGASRPYSLIEAELERERRQSNLEAS